MSPSFLLKVTPWCAGMSSIMNLNMSINVQNTSIEYRKPVKPFIGFPLIFFIIITTNIAVVVTLRPVLIEKGMWYERNDDIMNRAMRSAM